MLAARLHTAHGYTATVAVPPFDSGFPPVIAWADRTWVRSGPAEDGVYREAFCFVATVVIDANDGTARAH